MKCSVCKAYRTRLYRCAVCGRELCGCCSYRTNDRIRVCCHGREVSRLACLNEAIARRKAASVGMSK